MSLPIRIKLENALVAYVKSKAIDGTKLFSLGAYGVVAGHTNQELELPFLVIYCGEAPPHPDMPAEEGIKLATAVFHLQTSATDEERAKADVRLEELETLIMQPLDDDAAYSDANKAGGRILRALNKAGTGADTRAADLRQFHCYDLWPTGDTDANRGGVWQDQLVFQVVCQPFDSH